MPASPTPGRTSDGTPPGPPSRRRSLIPGIAPEELRAAGIGQVVEWFDWTAYALLALYFSNQFFPEESAGLVAVLGTFGIMAVGFVVRPISGLLIGAQCLHWRSSTTRSFG